MAAQSMFQGIVQLLLDAKADVHIRDNVRNTVVLNVMTHVV